MLYYAAKVLKQQKMKNGRECAQGNHTKYDSHQVLCKMIQKGFMQQQQKREEIRTKHLSSHSFRAKELILASASLLLHGLPFSHHTKRSHKSVIGLDAKMAKSMNAERCLDTLTEGNPLSTLLEQIELCSLIFCGIATIANL